MTQVSARSRPADAAIQEIAAGRPVILLGDPEQQGEADLVFAAALATPTLMAACVRLTGGFICVALPADRCEQLRLPPQHWPQLTDGLSRGFPDWLPHCVTVDADGTGTGISATDRSRTVRALADPTATYDHFTRPGHVIPVLAGAGSDHVDAAVRLAELAGLPAASVLSRIVSEDRPTMMARGDEIHRIAAQHRFQPITVAEVLAC